MAGERPAGASSSPSDRIVHSITLQGAGGRIAKVDLTDGSSFFCPADALRSSAVRPDAALDEPTYERLVFAGEVLAAHERAVGLLAIHDNSRARLALKLEKRGFSAAAVRSALETLAREGTVDDDRFSRVWLASRLRRNPEGKMKLFAGLLAQGVPRAVASRAVEGISDEEEQDALERAAASVSTHARSTRERMIKALAQKGFRLPAVRRIVDERFQSPG